MAIARFKKLCMDANDPARLGAFWAEALDRTWRPGERGEGGVFGTTPRHTIWFNLVPEGKPGEPRTGLLDFMAMQQP
jgi:hypothetical protein